MQITVMLMGGTWNVLQDAIVLGSGVTRSAAIQIAHALRFQAEAQGDDVELVIQDLIGSLNTRYSGET